jgi:hypothetical protein
MQGSGEKEDHHLWQIAELGSLTCIQKKIWLLSFIIRKKEDSELSGKVIITRRGIPRSDVVEAAETTEGGNLRLTVEHALAHDTLLAEFASVVDTVQYAVEIQEELKWQNAGLPGDRRMEFRIGVDFEEVMGEREKIFGDAVNMVARGAG